LASAADFTADESAADDGDFRARNRITAQREVVVERAIVDDAVARERQLARRGAGRQQQAAVAIDVAVIVARAAIVAVEGFNPALKMQHRAAAIGAKIDRIDRLVAFP
jgi:hypothetical protein